MNDTRYADTGLKAVQQDSVVDAVERRRQIQHGKQSDLLHISCHQYVRPYAYISVPD